MLDVLILEKDPVISLDLADAARTADPSARIRVVDRASSAGTVRCTHAFLRAAPETMRLARLLSARGARVFLLDADRLPRELEGAPGMTVVPFPFTAVQLSRYLAAAPDPGRRACRSAAQGAAQRSSGPQDVRGSSSDVSPLSDRLT